MGNEFDRFSKVGNKNVKGVKKNCNPNCKLKVDLVRPLVILEWDCVIAEFQLIWPILFIKIAKSL